jgi:hypothetical protein
VIARDDEIKNAETQALLRLKQPIPIAIPITCELEKELPLVAPVCQVPDVTRQVVAIRSGHLVDPPCSTAHSGIENGVLRREMRASGERSYGRSGGCVGPTRKPPVNG